MSLPCVRYYGQGRNSRGCNRAAERGSQGDGNYRGLAAKGRDTREENRSLSTIYREWAPYRVGLGTTLREKRGLHPHTTKIRHPYPRNRHPFGSGQADHRHDDWNPLIRGGHSVQGVREAFVGRGNVQQLVGTESRRCHKVHRTELHCRPVILPPRQDRMRHIHTQHRQPAAAP